MDQENFLQQNFAARIGGSSFGKDTKIYKFEKIKRAKRAAAAENPGVELIDMGVGEPDDMAFPCVVSKLAEEAANWANRTYADNGCAEFKAAAARYMKSLYGVELDPDTQIVHAIGSKSALTLLPSCFINPGDITVITVPGYPVMGTWTKYLGGEVVALPLLEENGYLPDLESLTADQRKRTKLLYLNYPNNPTGASADVAFFTKAVNFARENQILIVSDAAYAPLNFKGKPLSILSIPGAKECAIEVRSFSKTAGFTGVRCGYTVVPNELYGYSNTGERVALRPLWLRRVCTKYNGTCYIAERAGEAVLTDLGRKQCLERINEYHHNARIIRSGLEAIGMQVYGGVNSPYIWMRTPDNMSSWQYFDHLLNTVQVVCTPGVGFGKHGEGFVRFSAFGLTSVAEQAIARLTQS